MNSADHALIELLRRDVLGDAVPVSLDAPNRPWTQAAVRPTVNLWLYDVRENLGRREVMLEPVRDSSGAVVGRRPPPTRYDLYYLLSVWGCPVALEHQLLAAIVSGLGSYDILPRELFETPDESAPSSFLSTAGGMKRGMLPMYAGELKLQVELTVTTQVPVSATTFEAGPPVREPARITVLGQSPEAIAGRGRITARMPHPRVAEADPNAATRAAIAAAVEALPPPPPAKPPAPAGGPPGAARPPGAAGPGGARPPGAAPTAPPAGARPPGAAGPPKAPPPPLVQLRAALAQAAQAQAVLAQAVASLSTMLPSGAPAQASARPPAGPPQPPAAAPKAPPQPPVAEPDPRPATTPAPGPATTPATGPATTPTPDATS